MGEKMTGRYERYDALDGLRVLAMAGILVMHVLANLDYENELAGFYRYIVYFGDFTALFMIVSAFSVSCGYYHRIKNGNFDEIQGFYKKRYSKLFPFFCFLTAVDVLLELNVHSIYEGIANISFVFGLIPHEGITVIGVGWTLGVIFVFYLLYPFFVFCMSNTKRFMLLSIGALFYAFVCNEYFGLGKVDFLYCALYFVTGCGLYLYRDKVKNVNRIFSFVIMLVSGFVFFAFKQHHALFKYAFLTFLMVYAIVVSGKKTILANKFLHQLNNYSFEIYLCHMVAFRCVEKTNLTRLFDSALLSYTVTCILVFAISFVIAYAFKFVESKLKEKR